MGIGVETGNDHLRRSICNRNFTNAQLIKCRKIASKNRLSLMSYNMIGLPGETRNNIFETIRINRRIKSRPCIVYFFYPFKGTPLRDLCEKNGYLMKGDNKEARPTVDSILQMPQITREELKWLKKTFPLYLRTPELLWPVIRLCEKENAFARAIYNVLMGFYSWKLNYLERI